VEINVRAFYWYPGKTKILEGTAYIYSQKKINETKNWVFMERNLFLYPGSIQAHKT
jgi:hypothetical protein